MSRLGSTVRVSNEDKEKLEKLIARAIRMSGRDVTEEEILGALLDNALSHRESLFASAFRKSKWISEEEFERIRELISDWGVGTDPGEIDHVLYGTKTLRRKK